MTQNIYQVDAFTSLPYGGNPAGVCILKKPANEDWMKKVAREMNLSETAFLVRRQERDSSASFSLRWFTPAVEVELCGHATLASAHILWETGELNAEEIIHFHTLSGLLTAEKKGDWIEMNFPAKLAEEISPPPGLEDALGVTPLYVGKNQFDYLVELESEVQVRGMLPDFTWLGKLPVRGTIVTSRAGQELAREGFDFVSRFFAPAVGVDEDPVTGSAHSCLAPYWGKKLGKSEMLAYQASLRGGVIKLRLEGERVILVGQAITVLEGNLLF